MVATLGTTGMGAIDPLPEILALREKYGFRRACGQRLRRVLHSGGESGALRPRRPSTRIGEADSIVIDPHKHGLQPYGCGCVLFRDPAVGALYRHDSPYTYFSSTDLHLGEISLECSRAGASAVALWATQRLLPLEKGGKFAAGLESSRRAALELARRLEADPRFAVPFPPELDIVVWAPRAGPGASQRIFDEAAALRPASRPDPAAGELFRRQTGIGQRVHDRACVRF